MYSSYTAWVAGVKDWLDVDDYTDAKIGEFIEFGQLRLDRELNSYPLEKSTPLTVAANGVTTLPVDFNRVRLVSIAGTGTYDAVSKNEFVKEKTDETDRHIYVIDAGTLSLWPTPIQGAIVTFDYYQKVPPIKTGVNSNLYTDSHADLLLWASMIEGFTYMVENDRLQVFETKYQSALDNYNNNPKKIKLGSTPLRRAVRIA